MPESLEMVWVEDRAWRVPSQYHRCRMPKCQNAPVADLFRTLRRGKGGRWYAYCAGHLYGRRVEAGKVLRRVAADSQAARQGYTGEG